MDKDQLTKFLAILLIIILAVIAAGSVAECYDTPMLFCNRLFPFYPSSRALTTNVEGGSGDIVFDSLDILTQRKDPMAAYLEVDMLQSDNDYEWLKAAIYLGACGRQEAVPYLIKALRHTALRSHDQEAQYLRELTGQNFGTDFEKWKSWWEKTQPDSKMDWNSNLGPSR